MRQLHPICPPREFVGDTSRIVVERVWRKRPSGNGRPAYAPVMVVHVHLAGVVGEGVIVLTPDRFEQLVNDLASVNQRVQQAAREMLREPGECPHE